MLHFLERYFKKNFNIHSFKYADGPVGKMYNFCPDTLSYFPIFCYFPEWSVSQFRSPTPYPISKPIIHVYRRLTVPPSIGFVLKL